MTAPASDSAGASDRPRVLCIDDEPNVLKSLRRLLRRENFELHTADSAEAALDLLDDLAPAVIVSDQRMPGMQGTEFLEIAREKLPESIRIVLSGFADAATILEAINRGHIYRFLTKPWDDDRLREAIVDAVRRHDLDRENRRLAARVEAQNVRLRELNRRLEATVASHVVTIDHAQQLLERLPVAVVGVDADGRVAFANVAAGGDDSPLRDALPDRSVSEFLSRGLAAAVTACLADAGDAGAPRFTPGLDRVHVSPLLIDGVRRGCLLVSEVFASSPTGSDRAKGGAHVCHA